MDEQAVRRAGVPLASTTARVPEGGPSLRPPEDDDVSAETSERVVDEIEATLGLAGQQRGIVFDEKQGRRHPYCVWSPIDTDAIDLSHAS